MFPSGCGFSHSLKSGRSWQGGTVGQWRNFEWQIGKEQLRRLAVPSTWLRRLFGSHNRAESFPIAAELHLSGVCIGA